MEKQRALSSMSRSSSAFHGDAFNLEWNDNRASVLYLNPPYEAGRAEYRFLERFTLALTPAEGVLIYVVPDYVLSKQPIRDFLRRNYTEIRAWRFPEAEYKDYRQAVLIGRRAPHELDIFDPSKPTWSLPENLTSLPEVIEEPFKLSRYSSFAPVMKPNDTRAALQQITSRQAQEPEVGGLPPLKTLFDLKTSVAMSPQPAHIALALASGHFDGQVLTPDHPRHPKILAKGIFRTRSIQATEAKPSKDGKSHSWTEVERPSLEITVLDIRRSRFHTLKTGTLPAGGHDLSQWTAADLMANYQRALTRILADQFPAVHKPSEVLPLPALDRTPYARQAQVIQAALKTLAGGDNPLVPGEVGTGKTTIGVYIAEALKAPHHPAVLDSLRGYGLKAQLPKVARTLVLAPPHLMDSWRDEIRAIVPDANIVEIQSAADLEKAADYYLLSREKAKLGYNRLGFNDCSRCGTTARHSATTNARRKATCEHQPRIKGNYQAGIATTMAKLLAPYAPKNDVLATLASKHRVAAGTLSRRVFSRYVDILETASHDEASIDYAEYLDDLAPWAYVAGERLHDVESLLDILLHQVEQIAAKAVWLDAPICGEPLYQAGSKPRRIPLAKTISKKYKQMFDLLLVDEAHEYANAESAQTIALHRLLSTGVPAVALSGSFMGGYAEDLHALFWAFSQRFRDLYDRESKARFASTYGYFKTRVEVRESSSTVEYGSRSDRRNAQGRQVIGKAPGINPAFLFQFLLQIACPINKAHLDVELPPSTETRAPILAETPEDEELVDEYKRMRRLLLAQIKQDRYDPLRSGRLLGALCQLPTYLDRAFEPYEIIHPVDGTVIATGKVFPTSYRTPKERSTLSYLRQAIAAGERVLLFVSNTGSGLPQRLLDLMAAEGIGAAFLDAKKVSASKRQAWIDQHANDPARGVQVLMVNPVAVQTGLNNLKSFTRAYWYQWSYSAKVYRQANGRIHRIGQTRPVEVVIPYYAGTTQAIAVDLVAGKVTASLQFDGLDVQAALEAAGAGEAEDGLATALSIGQAVYDALERRAA